MTTPQLGAHYRRLLRAYPRGHRREEILDTLMEAAAPDRTRPTPRESANLLRHGMRTRLGRPRSTGVVVVAVLVALVGGFVGASLAARAAWEVVPAFPQGAALSEITDAVYAAPVEEYHPDELFVAYGEGISWGRFLAHGWDEEYAYATQDISAGAIMGDYQAFIRDARARLEADGWNVREEYPTGATWIDTGEMDVDGRNMWATRDGLSMLVSATTNQVPEVPGGFYATAEITRIQPPWVSLLAVGGWLVGALLGWLLTGWVSRRTEHRSSAVRTPTVIALVCMMPSVVLGSLIFFSDAFAQSQPGTPFWWPMVTYGFRLTQIALILTIVVVAIAALTRPRAATVESAGVPR